MECPGDLYSPSDAEILARMRRAYASACEAISLGKGDRHLTRNKLAEMRAEIEWLEDRLSSSAAPLNGDIILAILK